MSAKRAAQSAAKPAKRAARPAAKPAAKKLPAKRPARAKRKPAKRKPAAKTAPAKAAGLEARGASVVSVFGPYANKALVLMPAELATELFDEPLATSGRTDVIDAAMRDVEAIRAVGTDLATELADSTLAATAISLAFELAHPFNSATSKAAIARELRECVTDLQERLPPKQTADAVDDIADQRAKRRAAAAREAGAAT